MAAKTPLLLLPGLLCTEALWQHQVKALKGIAECIVADLTQKETIAGMALAALQRAPEKFALAGLSMGGYVALEIVRQAPGRVMKLCLLDTSARSDSPEQKHKRELFIAMSKSGQFKGVTPRLLPMLIHTSRFKDAALTDIIYGMAGKVGRDAFIRQQTAVMNRADSLPFLSSIKVPTQIICGREDMITPPDVMREIADGIKGAQMRIIPDCGHLSPLEQPDQVNETMKIWLAA